MMFRINFVSSTGLLMLWFFGASSIPLSPTTSFVTIQMKASPVSVARPLITIGDVATVNCDDELVQERIQTLDLELLESDQSPVTISKKQVRMRILVDGLNASNLTVRGPDNVEVVAGKSDDAGKVIQKYVANEFANQFAVERSDARIRLIDNDKRRALAEVADAIDSAIVIFPTEMPVGSANVVLEYIAGSGEDARIELKFRITVMQEIIMAAANIPRGARITEQHLNRVRRPIAKSAILPASFEESIGKTAATDIAAHSIVRTSHFERIRNDRLVKRNDIVDVLLRNKGFQMRLKNAKVLSSGGVGDAVQVMNTTSNTTLNAVVINKTTVEVK